MKTYSFRNDHKVPSLGLGTWKAEPGEIYQTVRTAIELGYRHFDCAFIYGNEKEIGAALNDAIMVGEVNRQELFITSKLWNTHHRAEDVIIAIKQSLKLLGLDYLDLYLMHWPVAQKKDCPFPQSADDMISLKDIPLDSTWQGMEECVMAGLVKNIGVSNFSIKKIKKIQKGANIKIAMNQVELHPLLQQKELIDFCNKEKIVLTAYSPLGSRDRHPSMKASDEPNMFEIPEIVTIANDHQCTPAQVLIAWAINRGTVVIPKSTNKDRLKQNLEAAEILLSEQDLNTISDLDRHYRYVKGEFFCLDGSSYTISKLWDE